MAQFAVTVIETNDKGIAEQLLDIADVGDIITSVTPSKYRSNDNGDLILTAVLVVGTKLES